MKIVSWLKARLTALTFSAGHLAPQEGILTKHARGPATLDQPTRNRICALLARTEVKPEYDIMQALSAATGRPIGTVADVVFKNLEQEFGFRADDHSVHELRDLGAVCCEDIVLLAAVVMTAIYAPQVARAHHARLGIPPDDLLAQTNRILEQVGFGMRVALDGVHPVDGEQQARVSEKFGILRANSQVEVDFAASKADPAGVALLFFDVDHFKQLNTKYTETVVDSAVLRPLQELIRVLVVGRGFAYSVGGDEFIVLLRNVNPTEALAFAERLRTSIGER